MQRYFPLMIAGSELQVAYPFGGQGDDDGFESALPTEPEQEYKPHPQKTYTTSITVHPPASFKPIPIQEQASAPKPVPPAVPPKPFKDTSIFQNVDTHAVEVRFLFGSLQF